MSRIFGPAWQNGYVVEDLDGAISHWVSVLGIGPFFKAPHLALEDYQFRGQRCEPDISIALAYSGNLQIELIQQHNDAPSHYADFRSRVGSGLHHLCTFNGRPFEENLTEYARLGYKVASSGKLVGAGRFAYLETEDHPGTVIEFGEGSAVTRAAFETIRQAAIDWDGTNPVRPLTLNG
jgi:hypothetical protein